METLQGLGVIGEAGWRALGRDRLRWWVAGQWRRRDTAGGFAATSFGVPT